MALQSSGRINLKQIATEYTDTAPHNMSEFYNGGSAGVSSNLVPSSGAIYLSDFYGATASTIIDSSAETVLLMKAIGSGADNADIDYQYGSNFTTQSLTFTSAGTPQATTFNPYRSGGYSVYLDGTGDYLTTGTSTDFAFGTGDFTWEMWIYHTAYEPAYLLEFGTGGDLGIHHATAQGHLVYYTSTTGTGSSLYTTGFGSMSAGNWYHIAAVRQSGTTYLYTDGVLQTSASDTTNYGSSAISCRIGAYGNGGSFPFTGYVRDVRIIKGSAQYTSAFTPPTEPLTAIANTSLLACHLPYIGDGSSSGHSITVNGDTKTLPFGPYDYNPTYTANQVAYGDAHSYAGSTYFDGTGDYLQVSNSSSYAFGTGDFTVEAWVNYSTFSGSGGQAIVSNGTSISSGTTGHWYLTAYGASDLRFGRHGSAQYTSVTSNLVVNAWNHIAVTRSGSTVRIFVNGVSLTTSNTGGGVGSYDFNNSSGYLFIGEGASFSAANGYISDVRIIKGTAQYTSDFTPPTTPNTWVTNTTLLAQTVYGSKVYDAAAANGLTLVGNTQSSTTQRKFTTSSAVYFDGTGDAIDVPETGFPAIGTADFTIETWVRASSLASNIAIFDGRPSGTSGGNYITLQWHASTYGLGFYSGGWRITSPTNTLTVNTWHHIALSRSGSSTKLFVDGTQVGSTYSDSTSYLYGRNYIGGLYNNTNTWWNGYMQDFRVSIGHARYTADFTPPTAEFEL